MGHTETHIAGASLRDTQEGREIAIAPTAAQQRDREPGDETRPLTPEQRAIVEFGEGPAVVIAGTGTDKTCVLGI
jgi:hypothetical protein